MELSPNGKLVAFTKSFTLFVRRLEGGEPTRIAKVIGDGTPQDHFAWSPDSTRIVFLTAYPSAQAIVSAAGGPVRRLSFDDPNELWNDYTRPIWSPDGRTILWQVLSHGEPDPANPGRYHTVYDWDRFRAIDVDRGQLTIVGPGTDSCRIQIGGDPNTGKRPPPSPCPASDPSWQPRK